MAIILGKEVTDSLTGLKGIAIARVEYLHGCVRIVVQPTKLVEGKRPTEDVFDELQLVENDPSTTPPLHFILGQTVTDSLTGCKGAAVYRSEYLHGGPRVGVQPLKLDKDGLPFEVIIFDEAGLKGYKVPKAVAVEKKTGGPHTIPPARSIAARA
jgi:hypothetical protein